MRLKCLTVFQQEAPKCGEFGGTEQLNLLILEEAEVAVVSAIKINRRL